MKQKVYLFDFDGTITTKDTFVALILYAVGTWKCLVGFALYSPLLLLMKLHLYPNWKAKQRVFSHFFKGKSLEDFNKLCRNFAADNRSLLRSEAMKAIDEARNQGEVYVVSASVDNWVQPCLPGRWPTDGAFFYAQLLWGREGEPRKTAAHSVAFTILYHCLW